MDDFKVKILQIYYDERTKQHLDPSFIPFDNSGVTNEYFENDVICRCINSGLHKDTKMFGILSWNVKSKSPYFFCNPEYTGATLIDHIKNNPETDIFCLNHQDSNQVPFIDSNGHPHMEEIARIIFDLFGGIIISRIVVERAIFMNSFIAKNNVYEAYVKGFLNPIMKIMDDKSHMRLQRLLWCDSLYKTTEYNPDRRARFKSAFGKEFYPYHSFICERLPSYWLALCGKKFKIEYL